MASEEYVSDLEKNTPMSKCLIEWVCDRWSGAAIPEAMLACGDMFHGAGMAASSVDMDVAMELWFLSDLATTRYLIMRTAS